MKFIYTTLLLLVACYTTSFAEVDPISYNIGQQSLKYTDSDRNRPLEVEIWYPTHDPLISKPQRDKALFQSIPSIPNAQVADKKFPLLIVSHGTGGNRFSLTWLIEKMVKTS